MKKLNYSDVEDFFISEGSILIKGNKYEDRYTKLNFKCVCGRTDSLSYHRFRKLKCCTFCAYPSKKASEPDYFKSYINSYSTSSFVSIVEDNFSNPLIEFKCICGSVEKIYFRYFKKRKYKKCKACTDQEQALSYVYVRDFFTENNCKLMTSDYRKNTQPLKFLCHCGRIAQMCFATFKIKRRCQNCGKDSQASLRRKSLEEVEMIFEKHNCKLMDIYKNNSKPLKFLCSCGKVSKKSLSNFIDSPRCPDCSSKYLSKQRKGRKFPTLQGERNYQWNHTYTETERIQQRRSYIYKEWRNNVFYRDKYTCQACGDDSGGNLNAHHLDGYSWNYIDRYNPDNGVTLCSICHREFHDLYGFKDNYKEQFTEFQQNLFIK